VHPAPATDVASDPEATRCSGWPSPGSPADLSCGAVKVARFGLMGQGATKLERALLAIVWLALAAFIGRELSVEMPMGDWLWDLPGLVIVVAPLAVLPVILTVAMRKGSAVRRRRGRLPKRHLVVAAAWTVGVVVEVVLRSGSRSGAVIVTDLDEYERKRAGMALRSAVGQGAWLVIFACAVAAVLLVIVDSAARRRTGHDAGPTGDAPSESPVELGPGLGDRLALTAVWSAPLAGVWALSGKTDMTRAVLLYFGWPVLLGGAVWGLVAFQRVLGSRSPWLVLVGYVPRRFRVAAWVWLAALPLPGLGLPLAGDAPTTGDHPDTLVEMAFGEGLLSHALAIVLEVLAVVAPFAALAAVVVATGGAGRRTGARRSAGAAEEPVG
jgi:hypothetical protein